MLKPVVPVFILISPGKIFHLEVCIHTSSMPGRGYFIVLEDAADIPDSVLNANYYGSVSSINSMRIRQVDNHIHGSLQKVSKYALCESL